MLNKFKIYITEMQLCKPTDQILLAVSGGIDSIVMLDLCIKSGLKVGIAHCNFGLRGAESDGDEVFVCELAQQSNVPFFTQRFDTKKRTEVAGISTQMAARELRYAWFGELLRTKGFDYLATAHHLNDSIETVILNLVRGTGLAGLSGIPIKNASIIRPLSFATRAEIVQYAQENRLQWREDSSNAEDKYQRNFIRHQVIPLLQSLNPNLEQTFAQTLIRINQGRDFLNTQVEIFENEVVKQIEKNIFIDYTKLIIQPSTALLFTQILEKYGFNAIQSAEILVSIEAESGKQFFSPSHILVKDRNQFVITPKNETIEMAWTIEAGQAQLQTRLFNLQIQFIEDLTDFLIPTSQNIACLDYDLLAFPLKIRKWQQGDFFYPLGMKGRKKISDFLIDLKIPRNLKENVYLLESNGEIVWIIGYRLDNRFKISKNTQKIVSIEVQI
jgi:tRNA(Ile)-lysidine synthase